MLKQYYKPETYKARNSIGYLVRRARNLITQQIEARFKEKGGDIGFIHFVILMCLRDDLARTPSEICQYICHDSGALTRVLDQMEERGLIKRHRSTSDRRRVEISLAPKGVTTVENLIGIVTDFYNETLVDFSHSEADMLISLLGKFLNRLDSPKGH